MLGRVAAVLRRKPQAAAFIEIHEYDVGRILEGPRISNRDAHGAGLVSAARP
jgi:hypothetical protein